MRLKREHLNIAKFEPDNGLDPTLDLALVGSEWQFRIQGRSSKWQEKLVVTSTRSVEQDLLSKTEVNLMPKPQVLMKSCNQHETQTFAALSVCRNRIDNQPELKCFCGSHDVLVMSYEDVKCASFS